MILIAIGSLDGLSAPPVLAGTHAPVGFRVLCLNHPSECKGGGAASLRYSHEVMQTVTRINASINAQIRPKADSGSDIWSVNVASGDCEDYVMTKRHALIGAGLPASALRIAWVKTRDGQQHAVLVIKTTDQGDLVLDNLRGTIRSLSQTGYRVLAISGPDPKVWS
jgi:predicted transglutaminase-like cysteine proteinase